MNTSDTETSPDFEPLRLTGIAPNLIRELSGVYPNFVSAFKELVSNAYDADATRVKIRLAPDWSTITIEDNGLGMTPFEFQNDYIRIGGSVHRRRQDLTPGGRQPIGRKGIGFLAVARYCQLVEIYSHADRKVTLSEEVTLESRRIPLFLGAFAHTLESFTNVQAVRCGSVELTSTEYSRDGLTIELVEEAWHKFKGQTLIIRYLVDCCAVDMEATIDYEYLLNLEGDRNLEALRDFCQVRIVPIADTKESSLTNPGQSFTRVTLHLREFVQQELQAPKRPGWVRNVASSSGQDRFLWHLSRGIPTAYDLPSEELERCDLELLTTSVSPTPFRVQVVDATDNLSELKRPLLGEMNIADLEVKRPVSVESDGLKVQGYILGFSQLIFPAELRGIGVRVRGVEIGEPDLLGIEDDIPTKYRPFLNQVMGEVIVTEGLDAISAIAPGREEFYADNAQFQALRRYLVGDGTVDFGILGQVLEELRERSSVESSVQRIVQEARRRREAFLDVSHAITTLSVGSRYGRALHRLFTRSDIVANGLCQVPKYQIRLPGTIGDCILGVADLAEGDYRIEMGNKVIQFSPDARAWDQSLYILGRDFEVSLRSGGPADPVCEIDFSTDTIYLNWMHPTRTKMGAVLFVKSALFWRVAYLAAEGDVDLMMNLAHRLLSLSA